MVFTFTAASSEKEEKCTVKTEVVKPDVSVAEYATSYIKTFQQAKSLAMFTRASGVVVECTAWVAIEPNNPNTQFSRWCGNGFWGMYGYNCLQTTACPYGCPVIEYPCEQ